MAKPFDLIANPRYTQGRFKNTIQMYKGKPAYISAMDDRLECSIVTLDAPRKIVNLDKDKGWSFGNIPVGHTLVRDNLIFIAMLPARQWKQGLCNNNIAVIGKKGAAFEVGRLVSDPVFNAVATGDFDTIGEAGKFSDRFKILSRTIALTDIERGAGCLTYRGKTVGTVTGEEAALMGSHRFLKETLEEMNIHVKG